MVKDFEIIGDLNRVHNILFFLKNHKYLEIKLD